MIKINSLAALAREVQAGAIGLHLVACEQIRGVMTGWAGDITSAASKAWDAAA